MVNFPPALDFRSSMSLWMSATSLSFVIGMISRKPRAEEVDSVNWPFLQTYKALANKNESRDVSHFIHESPRGGHTFEETSEEKESLKERKQE